MNENKEEKENRSEIDPEVLKAWKMRMARNDLDREIRKSSATGRRIATDSMTVQSRYIYNEISKNYRLLK